MTSPTVTVRDEELDAELSEVASFVVRNALNGLPIEPGNIDIELWRVTPEIAMDWIEKNDGNRPKKVSGIERYIRDIQHGRWMVNGESIKFGTDGTLLDGQNRLYACIAADAPFWTFVFWGLPPDAFKTLDTGVKRSFADILSLLDYSNANMLAAAVNELWRYEQGIPGQSGVGAYGNNDELLAVLKRHEDIVDSIAFGEAVSGTIPRPSQTVFCHYVFSRKDHEQADWFFDALATGAGLAEYDGLLHLRNRLMQEHAEQGSPNRRWQLAMTIKAWNAHREGREVKVLRWSEYESFPEIQ